VPSKLERNNVRENVSIQNQREVTDDVISWKSNFTMPPALVTLVNTRRTIYPTNNNDERPDDGLDSLFLSSQDLHTLAIVVHAAPCPETRLGHKMSLMQRGLSRVRNLKTIRLNSNPRSENIDAEHDTSTVTLESASGKMLPALQELTLDDHARIYDLSHDHCHTWANAMNWNQLRKLDLGCGSPTHLLDALCGCVPQLKDLAFGFWPSETNLPTSIRSCVDNTDILIRFLNSIDGLERVLLRSWDDKDMCKIWPALLAKHGSTLRDLESDLGFRDAWDEQQFSDIYNKAPGLKSLKATMKLEDVEGKSTVWPNKTQKVLTSFRSLRHLTLLVAPALDSHQLIRLHPLGWNLTARALLNKKDTGSLVRKLWNDFGSDSATERLEVAVITPNPCTRVWTFRAEMKWREEYDEERLVVEWFVNSVYCAYD
jgi:hypothetical protein